MDSDLVFVDYDPLDCGAIYDNSTLLEDCSKLKPKITKPPQEGIFRPKIEKTKTYDIKTTYKRSFVQCGW
jgi:hypothetical protein